MKTAVYLTVVASSALCLGIPAHAGVNGVTLDLGGAVAAQADLASSWPAAAAGAFDAFALTRAAQPAMAPVDIIGELASGFHALGFRYASSAAASVRIYDDVGGSGRLLGAFTLAATGQDGTAARWRQQEFDFGGLARSFVIRAHRGAVRLDQLRFATEDAPSSAPDGPSGAALVATGLAALLAVPRREQDHRIRPKSG